MIEKTAGGFYRGFCDACLRQAAQAQTPKQVQYQASRVGYATVLAEPNGRTVKVHLCPRCVAEWPATQKAGEFIMQKRSYDR